MKGDSEEEQNIQREGERNGHTTIKWGGGRDLESEKFTETE